MIIPVFEDPEEQKTSPYKDEDWYGERMSWKWMNTIMRVNSLVQKVGLWPCKSAMWSKLTVQTVIIAYVTVPSLASFPSSARLSNSLKPSSGDMEDLLKRYTVREVVLVSA